jgi:hypothetical protein
MYQRSGMSATYSSRSDECRKASLITTTAARRQFADEEEGGRRRPTDRAFGEVCRWTPGGEEGQSKAHSPFLEHRYACQTSDL